MRRRHAGHRTRIAPALCAAVAIAGLFARTGGVQAQEARGDTTVYRFGAITVTATRSPKPVFSTAAAVAVIDSAMLARARPNTVVDVFREQPGVDVTGVGVQQPRPIIRGQRGQRILLLQDGLRLNNTRRQHDFGEVPALADVSTVERVEVVRGPSSVLYGTDAIGGVVNIISRSPATDGVHGLAVYRFGGAQEQHRGVVSLSGRSGALDFLASATMREAGSYRAPAGSFGAITLEDEATVHGTGVQDRSLQARVGYTPAPGHHLFVRADAYAAEDAGFGFVEPGDYAPGEPRIDIHYPEQRFAKLSAGYSASLRSAAADAIELTVYGQDNERDLHFDLFQSFGPQAPPGAGVSVRTYNFTDLRSVGFRAEARKLAAGGVLLTYGADLFRDRSENTDSSRTVVSGFGPPQVSTSSTPPVPNATFRSMGAFVQAEVPLSSRFTATLGGRLQDIQAETRPTPGLNDEFETKSNRTAVGAANLLFRASESVALIGSIGRGFRSPNLIEWFYEGVAPEGNAYQMRNTELEPETSVSIDVGARYRSDRVYAEAFAFRNEIADGIRAAPTGTQVNGLPAFQNVNLEELVFRGVEAAVSAVIVPAVTVHGSYTLFESEDALDPDNPVGDSFSSKLTGGARFDDAAGRFWAEYHVRHNGERREVQLGENPVGDVLPAFTVHGVRGGVTVFRRGAHVHRVGIAVDNLADRLYAESSNVSFFRPEPGRSVTLTYQVAF